MSTRRHVGRLISKWNGLPPGSLVNRGYDYRTRPNYNRNTSACKRARRVKG